LIFAETNPDRSETGTLSIKKRYKTQTHTDVAQIQFGAFSIVDLPLTISGIFANFVVSSALTIQLPGVLVNFKFRTTPVHSSLFAFFSGKLTPRRGYQASDQCRGRIPRMATMPWTSLPSAVSGLTSIGCSVVSLLLGQSFLVLLDVSLLQAQIIQTGT
jgi:hypothetical protein